MDADLRYCYASPKIQDILGYAPEEVIGKTPWDLMAPEVAARVHANFDVLLEAPRPFRALENTNLRKDGLPRVLETSGVPLFDSTGKFAGFRGIDRDITAHKRAEEALRFRLFLQMSPDMVWRLDFDPPVPVSLPLEEQLLRMHESARMGECNDVVARHFGAPSSAAIIGRSFGQLMAITGAAYSEAIRQFIREGYRLSGFERDSVRADGARLWLLSNNIGIIEDGALVSVWGAEQDITERKRAEVELRPADQELASIHASAPVMLPVPDEELRIQKVNPRALDELGLTARDMLGRQPGAALGCAQAAGGCGLMAECAFCALHGAAQHTLSSGASSERVEARLPIQRDGKTEWRYLSVSTSPLEWNGHKRVLFCAQDITGRKRAEEALRASESRMRAIFDQACVGVALVETQTGILRSVNQRFCDIVGRAAAELEGTSLTSITHPDDLAADESDRRSLLGGETSSQAVQARDPRPDGALVWVSRTVSRLVGRGAGPDISHHRRRRRHRQPAGAGGSAPQPGTVAGHHR